MHLTAASPSLVLPPGRFGDSDPSFRRTHGHHSAIERPRPPRPRHARLLAAFAIPILAWATPADDAVRQGDARQQASPALRFTSADKFYVHPVMYLHQPNDGWTAAHDRRRQAYVGLLTAEGASDPDGMTFRVERQTGAASPRYCWGTHCSDIAIEALADSGDLLPRITLDRRRYQTVLNDFPTQRLEVSVASGQRKVYREVLLEAPKDAPDCSDYTDMNEDRYRCYHTQPTGSGKFSVPNSNLVSALPDELVKPKTDYELVFAEEFNGSYSKTPANGCFQGLADLGKDKWTYSYQQCLPASQSRPCSYLEGGQLHIAETANCNVGIETKGLFRYRYGYLEVQYTFGLEQEHYKNHNVVLGDLRRSEAHALATHGLVLDNLEEYATLVPWTEIDVFEQVPWNKLVTSHQYRNFPLWNHDIEPAFTTKLRYFCRSTQSTLTDYKPQGPNGCYSQDVRITVTQGLEWTPRGYRPLLKVHGVHQELVPFPIERIMVYKFRYAGGRYHTSWRDRRAQGGRNRDRYFNYPDPNRPELYLDGLGISHMPNEIHIGAWGRGDGDDITAQVSIDYVRVFQPTDRYADMAPLYE